MTGVLMRTSFLYMILLAAFAWHLSQHFFPSSYNRILSFVLLVFFFFYMTLDRLFAIVFLVGGFGVLLAAQKIGQWPLPLSGWIAAATFFGGYAMQFVGHAIEKSMPVLLRHPVQANLAAPFFVVVELFKLAGLREELFDKIRSAISKRDARPADVLDAQ